MKPITQHMAVLLAAIGLLAATHADDTKPSPSKDTELRILYDKENNTTTIATPLVSADKVADNAYYEASYQFGGKEPRRPRKVGFVMVPTARGRWKRVETVYLQFGDTTLELTALPRRVVMAGGIEYFRTLIDTDTFIRMSRADKVNYEYGRLKGTIANDQILPLRKLADHIPEPKQPD